MLHNFKHLPWPMRLAVAAGFLVLATAGLIALIIL